MTAPASTAVAGHSRPRDPQAQRRHLLRLAGELILAAAVLAAAVLIARHFIKTRPTATRQNGTPRVTSVRVVAADPVDVPVILQATGVVKPAREMTLTPEVSGRLVEISPALAPGQVVAAGEQLARIDDRDLAMQVAEVSAALAQNQADIARNRAAVQQSRCAVVQRERELEQRQKDIEKCQNDLLLEQAQAQAAGLELELLKDSTTGVNRDLVLRVPQMQSAQAAVEAARAAKASAEAAVENAKAGIASAEAAVASAEAAMKATQARLATAQLDLQRTVLAAPFDALIVDRQAVEGSQVGPGSAVATLVAVNEYWIEVTLPAADLVRIPLPQGAQAGAEAEIRGDGWPLGACRQGRVIRSLGAVESQGQMARLLVSVTDPLGREHGDQGLLLNAFVRVTLHGNELKQVCPVPRDAVHDGNQVLLAAPGDQLERRQVEIAWWDAASAYIARGIHPGERIIVSEVAVAQTGSALKVMAAAASEGAAP